MEGAKDSDELSGCWRDLADVLAAGISRVLVYGPPGTGKTFAALRHGVRHDVVERLVCTEDLTSGEITGTWMPTKEGHFEWREGPAIRAWRGSDGNGSRLVLDEVDRASGDALSTLLAITDSPESARWRNPETLEWVRPGSLFSAIMTSNIEDLDDVPRALRDRFPVSIRIDRPHPAAVARLSSDLRGAALSGSLGPNERRVSLRSFYAFDELRCHYGPARAAQLVFGEGLAASVLDALTIGAIS
ncbi:MAG TPA: AAA family ATPase [Acidimicrobiales bacterium]|nr:AAA family ATPase [Acidimicrobiales bacterium]